MLIRIRKVRGQGAPRDSAHVIRVSQLCLEGLGPPVVGAYGEGKGIVPVFEIDDRGPAVGEVGRIVVDVDQPT